jgi:hypothetical protein
MADAKGLQKFCVLCRQDCSNRPRTRDAKGHYYCKTCYDNAAARLAPAPGAAPADEPLALDSADLSFLDSVDQSAAAACVVSCPTCGFPLAGGSILCVNCGHRTDDPSAVVKTTVAKLPKAASRKRNTSIWPIPIGIITAGVSLILLSLTLINAVGSGDDNPFSRPGDPASQTGRNLGVGIGFLLYGLPLFGGVGLLMRRQQAVKLLRGWAMTVLGLNLGCGGCGILILGATGLAADRGIGFIVLIIALAITIAITCPWPIFLLIWFRRPKIADEVAEWR